jgi:single-strand DNA-binding protein
MGTHNRITIIGRLGQNPDVRTTGGGTKVAKFSIATDRLKKDAPTDWHRCVAWDKQAEAVERFLHKGDAVGVEGRMEYGSYEKDGVKVYTADVMVERVILLGSGQQNSEPARATRTNADPFADDDDAY